MRGIHSTVYTYDERFEYSHYQETDNVNKLCNF